MTGYPVPCHSVLTWFLVGFGVAFSDGFTMFCSTTEFTTIFVPFICFFVSSFWSSALCVLLGWMSGTFFFGCSVVGFVWIADVGDVIFFTTPPSENKRHICIPDKNKNYTSARSNDRENETKKACPDGRPPRWRSRSNSLSFGKKGFKVCENLFLNFQFYYARVTHYFLF